MSKPQPGKMEDRSESNQKLILTLFHWNKVRTWPNMKIKRIWEWKLSNVAESGLDAKSAPMASNVQDFCPRRLSL